MASRLQETVVWPATRDLDWSPILQGERRDTIPASQSQHLISDFNTLCTLLYHIWLKQMLVCVCYLCTISEEVRRRALASSSIYPFPKGTSSLILMFRVLISTISFLNKHLVFGPLYICELLYVYVIFSKHYNAQFVYSMANHLLSQCKSAQAVAPGTQFPGTEIKNRQHTNGWFLCSRRKSVGY